METNKQDRNKTVSWAGLVFRGVVKLPKSAYYWSKDKILGQTFPATVMSRNRFELLLQYLHFSDNLSVDRNDRIAKIRPLSMLSMLLSRNIIRLKKMFVWMKAKYLSEVE